MYACFLLLSIYVRRFIYDGFDFTTFKLDDGFVYSDNGIFDNYNSDDVGLALSDYLYSGVTTKDDFDFCLSEFINLYVRMVKVKTKVSGCFRSEEGAQEYLTIMSYIGSARKHGINAFTAIREALNGNPNIIFN